MDCVIISCHLEAIRGGRVSRCFVLSRGTKGLWSVSISKCKPSMKVENLLQAHTMAKASFLLSFSECF